MMQVTNAFVACSLFWGRMDKYRDRCGTYSLHPDLVVITGDFVDDDTSKEDMIRASMGELMGENDMTYGIRRRGNTTFEVSSGISDWAIKFKTGCKAEYVVINIQPEMQM
ncbi:MAG: hypothetical protein Q4B57_08630 [Eubacteriales bacterium]|nr:hypothetical protein [Eubacteriales bacterium]